MIAKGAGSITETHRAMSVFGARKPLRDSSFAAGVAAPKPSNKPLLVASRMDPDLLEAAVQTFGLEVFRFEND